MNNDENQNVNNNINEQPVNNTPQVDNQGQQNNNQNTGEQNTNNQQTNTQTTGTQSEVDSGKVMAILSYFGLLVLIPYFSEKNNSFVVFHAKQGLNLLILEVIAVFATSFISSFIYFFSYVSTLVSLAAFVLSIIGIVYAAQGEKKELPVVSQIKIIK